jgi:dynactin 1
VVNVDVEEEIRRLKEDLIERATQIKLREKSLEESAVKIELLESRMRNVTKQSERIQELEGFVAEGLAREKDLTDAIEHLNEEIQTLETDVAKWKKAAEDKRAVGGEATDRAGQERAVATAREVAALKKEILNFKGAVAFFREENNRLGQIDHDSVDSWLHKPLINPLAKNMADYEAELAKEGRDVLAELRNIVVQEKVVDLHSLPENRMAWKPVHKTPRWTCARQRERYEVVVGWKDDLVHRVQSHTGDEILKKMTGGKPTMKWEGPTTAQLQVGLPTGYFGGKLGDVGTTDKVVIIHEPDEWEGVKTALGVGEC